MKLEVNEQDLYRIYQVTYEYFKDSVNNFFPQSVIGNTSESAEKKVKVVKDLLGDLERYLDMYAKLITRRESE
jgi:hypothetical protein